MLALLKVSEQLTGNLKNVDSKLLASVKGIIGEYSCDVANQNCLKSICPECPSATINDLDFEDSSSSSSNSEDSSSADSDERIAAHTCISKVIDIMMEKYSHLKSYMSVDLHVWSNGCSAQFRSEYVFVLTSLFPESFNVTRYYNERRHGKGPIKRIGGCVKNVVYRAVMARREVIKTPKEFEECAQKLVVISTL